MLEHLKTAKKQIRRSPYQALSAVLIMSLTFFVATILATLAFGLNNTLTYYETSPKIITFLKNEATPGQVDELQIQLEQDSRIKELKYVTKEEALELFKKATSDRPVVSELVSPKVFPASLEFSAKDLSFAQQIIDELKTNSIVDRVSFTASLGDSKNIEVVITRLKTISSYMRYGGATLLSFLIVSSLLVLLVILGMHISSRREEIEILQLIGATSSFVRAPFLLEGIFYAVAGATIGWFMASLLILYTMPAVASYFNEVPFLPIDLTEILLLFGTILGIEILMGTILGFLGSFVALKRYLRI